MTNVVLGALQKGEIVQSESITGNVMSDQQANIYPKVSGNIERIFVDIGSNVGTGQVLALIDTTVYAQNARQARAAMKQAQANAENAKLNFDRNKALLDQNLISKQEVDNARTSYNVAQSQQEAASANLSNAMTQLSYCRVRAPFSGTIVKRMFDAGAYVSPTNPQGSTMFILADLSKLKVMIPLPEKDVNLIPQIKDIIITSDALPNMQFKGRLGRTAGAVDLSTRTMDVEINIENNGRALKPGMFVNINLILNKKENTPILPHNVVQNDENGNFVFVVTPDSTAHKKYIQLGIQQNGQDEVLSGIDENDRIVVQGQTLVKDRSKVRILKGKK
jgi:RND family efflux transporter MFP subunit